MMTPRRTRLNSPLSSHGQAPCRTLRNCWTRLLAAMVPRPFRTENMRAPVLFRVVDQQQPILLLDEVDTYLHQADELRGLLNAGHKRGACAYRCEGAGNAI